MTPKPKSSSAASLSSRSKRRQLVSFELDTTLKQKVDALVAAGAFDSLSAYMRDLVRRDLGLAGSGASKKQGQSGHHN